MLPFAAAHAVAHRPAPPSGWLPLRQNRRSDQALASLRAFQNPSSRAQNTPIADMKRRELSPRALLSLRRQPKRNQVGTEDGLSREPAFVHRFVVVALRESAARNVPPIVAGGS